MSKQINNLWLRICGIFATIFGVFVGSNSKGATDDRVSFTPDYSMDCEYSCYEVHDGVSSPEGLRCIGDPIPYIKGGSVLIGSDESSWGFAYRGTYTRNTRDGVPWFCWNKWAVENIDEICEEAFGASTMKRGDTMAKMYFESIGKHYGVDISVPIKKLPREFLDKILYGTGTEAIDFEYTSAAGTRKYTSPFEGVIPTLERRHSETKSQAMRGFYELYMSNSECPTCHGARLNETSLAVKVGDKNINELTDMSVDKIKDYLNHLELSKKDQMIADQILKELNKRLQFLMDVGLEYLTLSRSAGTLSGGEAGRAKLFDVTYDPGMITTAIDTMMDYIAEGTTLTEDKVIPVSVIDTSNVDDVVGF